MFRQLRITYLLESTTLWGGIKVAFEQAEALSDAGHQVNILSKDSSPSWYPLKLPVIQVSDFNSSTIPDSDIIIGTYWTTVKSAYESGRGVLVHLCQGYEGDYIELSHHKKEIDEVYSYNIPKLSISNHLNRFLKERFGLESYYIGQMLNRDIFYPKNKSFLLNTFKKIVTNPLKILVVGPFQVDFKNISAALRGISLTEKKYKIPIKVTRVSQFPLLQEEEALRKPDKYYLHIPHQEMGNIYRESDLFISMSKEAEGFGLPALEAMACGVPTILSKISSYTSFDEIQDYSLFVDPLEDEALADAIYKIFCNKNLRKRFIHNGLRVAKRFTKEGVVKRLNEAFIDILDKNNKFSKTKNFWNEYHISQKIQEKKYWWDSPPILQHCQKLISGNPNINIYEFLKKELRDLPYSKGLSICAGSGEFERGLIENNICRQIDAYEIAEERVLQGIKVSTEKGCPINFFIEDVNKARFKENYYDLFISWSALHHIENLEGVCESVHRALKKGGVLLIQEYIGPNQLQWTDKQLEIINGILNILPERLRFNQAGNIIRKIDRQTIEHMNNTDPSEAIRAKDIIPVLKSFFDLKTIKYFGGSIFNPLFNEIIGNFKDDDEGDKTIIMLILFLEKILIENKILEDDYALIIAMKP